MVQTSGGEGRRNGLSYLLLLQEQKKNPGGSGMFEELFFLSLSLQWDALPLKIPMCFVALSKVHYWCYWLMCLEFLLFALGVNGEFC